MLRTLLTLLYFCSPVHGSWPYGVSMKVIYLFSRELILVTTQDLLGC